MYQLLNFSLNHIKYIKDGVFTTISNDPSNPLWIAYQEWLAEGNTPLEADPIQPPPTV
jgi:hypothetical protein